MSNQMSNQMGNQMGNQMSNQMSNQMGNQMGMIMNNSFNQQLEPMMLNGTNLDDDTNFNFGSGSTKNNLPRQDSTLIKSVAREIINGLKENNMSLYDNSSINSYKMDGDEYYKNDSDSYSSKSSKSKSSKSKNKVKEVVETLEDFISDPKSLNSTYSDYTWWFFDECFNYKDFLVLFVLYFVLSQEMIKDFFSKYFTCLNPDDVGKIGVQGVIIYGLILTILFMVIKKLF
jgi:hypothetical protein